MQKTFWQQGAKAGPEAHHFLSPYGCALSLLLTLQALDGLRLYGLCIHAQPARGSIDSMAAAVTFLYIEGSLMTHGLQMFSVQEGLHCKKCRQLTLREL